MSLISIGLSGLTASSAAISTIGNNTANVDTAGYSRQQVMTTASLQQNIGAGYIGSGTTLSDIRRIYNGYLDAQLQTSTALGADATAYSTQASKTDTLLSDTATGVSTVLAKFFTDMATASGKATDASSRATFMTTAGSLAGRFNSISAQLTSQNDNLNSQLTALAGQVNKLASSIADLNKQITSSAASGATPNTLLDTRNETVRQLNELVGAKIVENNGSYDVYIGTGQSLVTGSTAYKMSAVPSSDDPSQLNLKLTQGQGNSSDITDVITGGSMGGLLRYREEVLVPATNELGRVALVLADKVNTQLSQGVDANGDFGANLFKDINDPTLTSQRSIGDAKNSAGSGNLNVTITDSSKLTGDDYEITFNDGDSTATPPVAGDNFTVRRLPNGALVGTGKLSDPTTTSFEGFTVALPTPQYVNQNDTFKVTPTRNGASGIAVVMTDPKALAIAAPLTATAGASNSGSSSFTQPVLSATPANASAAAIAARNAAVVANAPVKLLFGAVAANGTQTYSLLDAKGNAVLDGNSQPVAGSIVQGQNNALDLKVGYGSATPQDTYTISMTISGSPAANDTFSIAMTPAGSSDNRNALATLELQTKQTVGVSGSGTGTSISATYASLVSGVGTKAAQGKSDVTATTAVIASAKGARDGVSGVSLDEEAANLVKYQQYYTASSQIIKAAQTIFSTLINSL